MKRRLTRVREKLARELHKEEPSPHYVLGDWQTAAELASHINDLQSQIRSLVELDANDEKLDDLDSWESSFDEEVEILRTARAFLEKHAPSLLQQPVPSESRCSESVMCSASNSSKHMQTEHPVSEQLSVSQHASHPASSTPAFTGVMDSMPNATGTARQALTAVSAIANTHDPTHHTGSLSTLQYTPAVPPPPPLHLPEPTPGTGSATGRAQWSNAEYTSDSESVWSDADSTSTNTSFHAPSVVPGSAMFVAAVSQAASHAARAAVEATWQMDTSNTPRRTPGRTPVQLPKLTLPTFHGDILAWPDFWDMFSAAVDTQQLPQVSKFTYLRSVLKGPAARLVSGIAVTDANYPTAVSTLKAEYGKPDIVIAQLYGRLQHTAQSSTRYADIKSTCEALENILLQLEAQGEILKGQRLVCHQVLSKLPLSVTTKLEEWRPSHDVSAPWDIEDLRQYLKRYVLLHDRAQQRSGQQQSTAPVDMLPSSTLVATSGATFRRPQAATSAPARPRKPCVFCGGAHNHDACGRFATTSARKDRLLELHLCYRCLGKGHVASACTQQRKCRHCQQPNHHNTAICSRRQQSAVHQISVNNVQQQPAPQQQQQPRPQRSPPPPPQQQQPQQQSQSATTPAQFSSSCMSVNVQCNTVQDRVGLARMMTATSAIAANGRSTTVRILFDSGSQSTFLSASAAEQLQLQPLGKDTLNVFSFGSETPLRLVPDVVQFALLHKDGSTRTLHAHVLPASKTIHPVQHSSLSAADRAVLINLPADSLADPLPDGASTHAVDLLLGIQYFWDLMSGLPTRLPSGLYLIPSRLGYLLSGNPNPATADSSHASASDSVVFVCATERVPDLSEMWSLDSIGISDSPFLTDDNRAQQHFNSTVRFRDGRYEVAWPWKSEPPDLRDNYGLALGRLTSLAKQLARDHDLLLRYDAVIQSQVELGIVERVSTNTSTHTVKHYLPHQPVVTPSKATTKLRIVYDASAKSSKAAKCLNECMHRGPINLPNLCGILLRFRCHSIVLLADIEKAFLQLSIRPDDRDVTRFLWFDDPANPATSKDNLAVYRFCRMPFGIVASPFLLEATIHHHLQLQCTPLAASIDQNIYVDNVLIGVSDVSDVLAVYEEAKSVFQRASMNLREWTTNSTAARATLPADDIVTTRHVKVLGLQWDTHDDVLSIAGSSCTLSAAAPATKRIVLQAVSALYDPLGLLVPAILSGRLLLRQLWQAELNWDDPLPAHFTDEWSAISSMMASLSSITIPRLCCPVGSATDVQLHIFTDASVNAYAAAGYLRVTDGSSVHSALVFSKMRLAPAPKKSSSTADTMTIPRLELLGAVIGARLASFLRQELNLTLSSTTVWTDARCVLHWLVSSRDLSTFVANRIASLRALPDITYRYVPSAANPADLATRPQTAAQLADSTLWWSGPSWLTEDVSKWPASSHPTITPQDLALAEAEYRGPRLIHSMLATQPVLPPSLVQQSILTRSSSLSKAVRILTYCMHFLYRVVWTRLPAAQQTRLQDGHALLAQLLSQFAAQPHVFSVSVRRLVLSLFVRLAQHSSYPDLHSGSLADSTSPLVKQFGLQRDQLGIIRCHGKLAHVHATSQPALLPRQHRLTVLIILDIHGRLLHAGPSHTLAQLRLNFWVPHGRQAVRHELKLCLVCRRQDSPPYRLPLMPPLPAERVNPAHPFEFTGLDYFGPLLIKQSDSSTTKVWVCLFTCFAIRAVHLEFVDDMSTAAFISGLRRFIARRGVPRLLYSDNASQFHLASSAVPDAWSSLPSDPVLGEFLSQRQITWKFTTALAPWQGGIYERMVGLVKGCMRKVVGRQLLSLPQLLTLLAEVDAVVNNRPLTPVSADDEGPGLLVLSPAHFLVGGRPTLIPVDTSSADDPDYSPDISSRDHILQWWRASQVLLERFWKCWRTEYLQLLRERANPDHRQPKTSLSGQPQVGEIVIVKSEGIPRGQWHIGKVTAANASATDGCVRSAEVLMPSGRTVERPLSLLYPLEVPSTRQDDAPAVVSSQQSDDAPGVQAPPPSATRPRRKAADQARQNIARWTACNFTALR